MDFVKNIVMFSPQYLCLFVTVLASLGIKKSNLPLCLWALTFIVGFYYGTMDVYGSLVLLGFAFLCYGYFHYARHNPIAGNVAAFCIFVLFVLLALHKIPGIKNLLVYDRIHISSVAMPFTMYLNFDKVMAALIFFLTSDLYRKEDYMDVRSLRVVGYYMLLSACLLLPAFAMHYIHFEPKITPILWLWALNNLFFVSFAEEVLFRGFVQNFIQESLVRYKIRNDNIAIIVASIIFGMEHFSGGPMYVGLSCVAGFFYGKTYSITKRISCAMLLHFSVNVLHILFFTYPCVDFRVPIPQMPFAVLIN